MAAVAAHGFASREVTHTVSITVFYVYMLVCYRGNKLLTFVKEFGVVSLNVKSYNKTKHLALRLNKQPTKEKKIILKKTWN